MKYWLVGMALGLLFPISFATSSATTTHYGEDYAQQAITDIATVEAAYNAVRLYYDGKQPQTDAKAAHDELGELIDRLLSDRMFEKPVPLAALGIQEQIIFAARRCQNYAGKISGVLPEHLENVFVVAVEAQLREYCAVQIHAAKMRLIDYGVANGVNPFSN